MGRDKAKRHELEQTILRQQDCIAGLSGQMQKAKRDLILLLGLEYEDYTWDYLLHEAARQIKHE